MIRVARTLGLSAFRLLGLSIEGRAGDAAFFRQLNPTAAAAVLVIAALFVPVEPVSAETPLEVAYPALRKTTCSILATDTSQPSHPTWIIGAGFFITNQGHLATNRHVVDDQSLTYDIDCLGKVSGAHVIHRSATHDLAILKSSFSNTPFNTLSEKHPLHHVGKEVFYMGSPRGLAGSFTNGTIGNTIQTPKGIVFQLSGLVNPGNSGGAVLDGQGQIVGIMTALLEDSPGVAAITPAYAALGDPEVRRILGKETSEQWEFMSKALESQLTDPRTRRLVAFVDQCYEEGGMWAVEGEEPGSMNEQDACDALRSFTQTRPRLGLYNLSQGVAGMSSATVLIEGDYAYSYSFLIKRFIGPERYEVLSVERTESPDTRAQEAAMEQFFVADLFWLNSE